MIPTMKHTLHAAAMISLVPVAAGVLVVALGPRPSARAIEQTASGTRPPAVLVASFDGLGADFVGPQGNAYFSNPSDNSLAVGPNHIVQIVNSRMAIYTKKGKL